MLCMRARVRRQKFPAIQSPFVMVDLRALRNGIYTDVKVTCSDKEYHLHRPFLNLASEYFATNQKTNVSCPGGPPIFNAVLDYCYEGEETLENCINMDTAFLLSYAAAHFRLDYNDERKLFLQRCRAFVLEKGNEDPLNAIELLRKEREAQNDNPFLGQLGAPYAEAIAECVGGLIETIAIWWRGFIHDHPIDPELLRSYTFSHFPARNETTNHFNDLPFDYFFRLVCHERMTEAKRARPDVIVRAIKDFSWTTEELRCEAGARRRGPTLRPRIGDHSSERIETLVAAMPPCRHRLGFFHLDVAWIISCLTWAHFSRAGCADKIIDWLLLNASRITRDHLCQEATLMDLRCMQTILTKATAEPEHGQTNYDRLGEAASCWLARIVERADVEDLKFLTVPKMKEYVEMVACLCRNHTSLFRISHAYCRTLAGESRSAETQLLSVLDYDKVDISEVVEVASREVPAHTRIILRILTAKAIAH